jgi:hypothetical protein
VAYTPPPWAYRPDPSTYGTGADSFAPSGQNEWRARLDAGGTFFRSKDVGSEQNAITVQVQLSAPTPPHNVTLTVRKGAITEVYTAPQDYSEEFNGPDGAFSGYNVTVDAIAAIRTQVNASSALIEMPARNFDVVDAAGIDGDTGRAVRGIEGPGADGVFTVLAQTNLAGGSSVASSPAGIRTGPDRTLIHVNRSERNNANGAVTEVNSMMQWSGSSALSGSFVPYP